MHLLKQGQTEGGQGPGGGWSESSAAVGVKVLVAPIHEINGDPFVMECVLTCNRASEVILSPTCYEPSADGDPNTIPHSFRGILLTEAPEITSASERGTAKLF